MLILFHRLGSVSIWGEERGKIQFLGRKRCVLAVIKEHGKNKKVMPNTKSKQSSLLCHSISSAP